MASFKFYCLSALICGVLVLGQAAEIIKLPVVTMDVSKTDPTEASVTTTDITTTETVTTTETTTKPDTTSSTATKPDTTTSTIAPKPDTTTTTTTLKPDTTTSTTTTTTTPPPPPPPAPVPPKPIGPPDQGLWSYVDSKNVTCVVVQFAAQLNVTYPKPNSTTGGVNNVVLNVPANASVVAGSCNGTEQWLTISWPATDFQNNTLTVQFAKNDTTKSYELKALNASLAAALFPNITNTINLSHTNTNAEWRTSLASSYRCAPPTELNMNADHATAKLTLSRLQEEAFRTAAGNGFSAPRDCAGGDIPDAVPIAVGCALGGMVLVVLIAYLVARRRSAARGYLSM